MLKLALKDSIEEVAAQNSLQRIVDLIVDAQETLSCLLAKAQKGS